MAQQVAVTEIRPARAQGYVATEERRSRYHHQVAGVITTAFTISVSYTLYNWIAGTPHGASDVRDPVLWGLYAFGFGLVPLVRLNKTWSWRVVLSALVGLLGLGLFYYPTLFTPEVQTPLGWVENDLYMGLLLVAAYLCVQRLRGITIATDGK